MACIQRKETEGCFFGVLLLILMSQFKQETSQTILPSPEVPHTVRSYISHLHHIYLINLTSIQQKFEQYSPPPSQNVLVGIPKPFIHMPHWTRLGRAPMASLYLIELVLL